MKKSILKLGNILSKVEQKTINGGIAIACSSHSQCPRDMGCCSNPHSYNFGLCMTGSDYRNFCTTSR